MKNLRNINHYGLTDCFIAGGSVLSTITKNPVADYDIYPKSSVFDVCDQLLEEGLFVVGVSDRAVTLKDNSDIDENGNRRIYQVIRGEFHTSEDIFKDFDFSVCMGALDCDTGKYHFGEDFWPDVASKTLRFNPKTKFPFASSLRIQKYLNKGYHIGKGEMSKVSLSVAERGVPKSWEDLEEAIGGFYGKSLKVDSEGVEFSIEKAMEILSNLDVKSTYEEPEGTFTRDYLKILLGDHSGVIYEHNGGFFFEDDFWITPVDISESQGLGNSVEIRDLTELPFVKGFKRLVFKNDKYIGASYQGNHNGVSYYSYEKVSYDRSPYLFCYLNSKDTTYGYGTHGCQVTIDVKDIVSIEGRKIQTRSMHCHEIKENSK